ncbi:MAG: tetratricopeptide repeat protein [Rhodospirillales bacterium]
MADHTDDHIFDEIEDDLRAERYAKLWKAYGKYIIAAMVILVVAVAGYQGWRAYDRNIRAAQSDRFADALYLLADKKPAEAQKAFAALAKDAGSGYRFLAKLRQAATMAENGDKAGAQKIYADTAADTGIDKTYRDLALLLSVLNGLDTGEPAALRARLSPLMADDNPWRYSAKETAALLDIRAGKRKEAYALLDALAKDAAAPPGIRQRAAELSAAVKP